MAAFRQYLQGFIQEGAVSFYQPFLSDSDLPHAVFFGYMVGVVEMFIGISLLLGFWVRFASVLGILHMLSLTLATWWQPGRGMPVWRYFGAELDHLPLLFLFVIFFVSDAGQEWGWTDDTFVNHNQRPHGEIMKEMGLRRALIAYLFLALFSHLSIAQEAASIALVESLFTRQAARK